MSARFADDGLLLTESGLDAIMRGKVDFVNDTITIALIKNSIPANTLNGAVFINDLLDPGWVVGSTVALTSKVANSAGLFTADDTVFASLSGDEVGTICLYKNTGVSTASPIIALYDSGVNLPFTPDGSDMTIAWSAGVVFNIGNPQDNFYDEGLEGFLNGNIDLLSATIMVELIDSGSYTFDKTHSESDLFFSGSPTAMDGVQSINNGTFSVDVPTTFGVRTGPLVEALVLRDSATDLLICYIDGGGFISHTPTGNRPIVKWPFNDVFTLNQ